MAASLDQLEREVEHARAQFASDIAQLRDPGAIAAAKEELLTQALGYKDEALGRARNTASAAAQNFFADLRLRVEQNPTAALVIGAGLAWRLFRHPPIASLLVAAGVASLVNTKRPISGSPTPTSDAILSARDAAVDRASRIASSVQTASREVQDQTNRARQKVAQTASLLSAQTAATADQAISQSAAASAEAIDYAADAAERTRRQVRENPAYFGVAALAVGAALGLAMNRANRTKIGSAD